LIGWVDARKFGHIKRVTSCPKVKIYKVTFLRREKNLIPVLYIFNFVLTALIVIGTDGMDRCNNILKIPTG
jgi:hypothetical protein